MLNRDRVGFIRMLLALSAAVAVAASYGAVLALGKSGFSSGFGPSHMPVIASSAIGPVALSGGEVPGARIAPERFGARGNGVHDDTRAIQQAIDAARGRTVWLGPNKTYLVTSELRLPSNTTIEGDGPSSVLKFTWFDGKGARSGGKSYLASERSSGGSTNIALSNFVLQGAGSGQPSGPNKLYPDSLACGVRLTEVDHFAFTHLEIADTPCYALGEFGSRDGVVKDNYIHNSGRGGIGMWWYIRNTAQIAVSHNRMSHVGDDAIAVNGLPSPPAPANHSALPTGIHIDHNWIFGWPTNINGRMLGNGIGLYGVSGVTLKGNVVNHTYGSGVLIVSCGHTRCPFGAGIRDAQTHSRWQSSNVRVMNNKIRNAGKLYRGSTANQHGIPTDGIFIGSAVNATVTGNVIKGPLSARIVSRQCRSCSISRS